MSYIVIEDFKAGMDRRRSIFSARPGSLWTLINAHLTRGGEIEKRKAFIKKHALPANKTFGLQGNGTDLFVFGSAAAVVTPTGVIYQRLQHPDGLAMTKLLSSDFFNGKVYTIAEYSDGSRYQFYDGVIVKSLYDGLVRASSAATTNNDIASMLLALITNDPAITSTVTTDTLTLTAKTAGVTFTVSVQTINKEGGVDDQSATITTTTKSKVGAGDQQGTATFQVVGGSAGTTAGINSLSKILVDGIDILGGAIDWTTSNSTTMQLIVAKINGYTATPVNYTAALNSGTITLTANAGSGATVNGQTVVFKILGDFRTTSDTVISGGVTSAASIAQVTTVKIIGTFELNDKFSITLNGVEYGAHSNTNIDSTQVLTHESKVYTVSGSSLRFSAVNDAVKTSPNDVGAGFINLSNHVGGNETLTGLDIYVGDLAIFSRRSVQIWHVEANDKNNAKKQIMRNTGTRSPNSVTTYGDMDLFYLADTGVRSLRARDSSNTATTNDVGTAIDTEIIAYMNTLSDAEIESAIGLISTEDDRYWLAIKDRIYVFSYFPASKISAWSYYEPGFVMDAMIIQNNKTYCRGGDTIYLYGDTTGGVYDNAKITAQLPYLDGGKPGTYKQFEGVDIGAVNTWDIKVLINPRDENQTVNIGRLNGVTYTEPNSFGIGHTTHMAPLLTCEQPGYAKLANMVVYYSAAESEA